MDISKSCPSILLILLLSLSFFAFGWLGPDDLLYKMRAAGWLRPSVMPIVVFRALFFTFGGAFLLLWLVIVADKFTPLIVRILLWQF